MGDSNIKYQPQTYESKWVAKWAKDELYKTPTPSVSPDVLSGSPPSPRKETSYSKKANVISLPTGGGTPLKYLSGVEGVIQGGDKKQYVLDMFPYPSGAGLHVGHVEGYAATDIYCRYMRMKGYKVLHPMGFDSFGLPAENYAVKTGTHPKITTEAAIETFTNQMKSLGLSYDWNVELAAHRPNYYRWTQWLFLLMYKRGLAYRKKQAVNWCNGCQTVLANEQVVDGKCERCETPVVQKEMEQWFLKITDYAERLLHDLDRLDWPESTKVGQRNWIGRSEGINITYYVKGIPPPSSETTRSRDDTKITVFTTRPDTNFGATFIVCAPDSEFVKEYLSSFPEKEKVQLYVDKALKKREIERVANDRTKTGVFTGWYAINSLNGQELPIYVADFALATVGTGCVVGVPGHDVRDFEFAIAMGLPVVRVVVGPDGDTSEIVDASQVQEELGTMVNSDFLNSMEIHAAKEKIMDYMVEKGYGERVVRYKLRDWLISRQRFWGAPIPMRKFKCQSSNDKSDTGYEYRPVAESELPVVLPMDAKFKPTGKSPLTEHPDFADREVDTMDTFVDSSWYFLRFAQLTSEVRREMVQEDKEVTNPFDDVNMRDITNAWCPVDLYVGGAEHTVLHLLYSRFFTKVLFDAGYVSFDEPFTKLRHQGTILGPDHRKMSKRWGNVINPLDVINQYGADTLRMYEMFMGPLDQMKAWNVDNVAGIYRFLTRVWNDAQIVIQIRNQTPSPAHPPVRGLSGELPPGSKDFPSQGRGDTAQVYERGGRGMESMLHKTIKRVTDDVAELKFNTAIAGCMEFMNAWEDAGVTSLNKSNLEKFLHILAPFAPFMTEELWSQMGHTSSIHTESWPIYDEKLLITENVEIPIQVNGKVRGTVTVSRHDLSNEVKVVELAKGNTAVQKFLTENVVKTIYVPGKILNIVCK